MKTYAEIPALSRRQFRDTMLVIINAELADSVCGVIDGVVVSRFLGEEAMAAHGIATPIFVILSVFTYLITVAFQQPCTVAIGKGEMRKANGLYGASILMALGFSFLLMLSVLLFPGGIAKLIGTPGSGVVHQMTADYLSAVSLGIPSLLLFLVLIPVLQIDGQRKLVHIGSLVMAVSDVAIDLLNVKVFHGGMYGIGLATTISYFLGLLVLLTYYFRKSRFFRFRRGDLSHVRVKHMLATGLPAATRVASRALAFVLLSTLVMKTMGTLSMTALSVQRNLMSVLTAGVFGVSGAALLLTGISYGEQDRQGLMDVVRLSAWHSLAVMGAVGLLFFILARPLVSLYLPPESESFTLAVHALRWLAVSMPLMSWTRSMGCYLQGIERNGMAMAVFVAEELVALVGCAALMGRIWGIEGVFAAFAVSQLLVMLVVMAAAYRKRDRRYRGMEAFLLVPETFGVAPENRLVRTLVREEEVWDLARVAQEFCLERGLPADKSYWVSMYIEEMGKLTMIYGFADGKPHHLEIRLSLYHGEVILRFRDDCRRFDIQERAAHWREDPEHPETSLSVRLVMRACKILKYNNSLNTNNLMVVL